MDGAERLVVFQRAFTLSLEVHRANPAWPKIEQYGGVADQLRRSSKSICALLVEGVGRQRASQGEFRRYLVMALGSADEARLWCRYAEQFGYVEPAIAEQWRASFAEVARMLQGLIAKRDKGSSLTPDP